MNFSENKTTLSKAAIALVIAALLIFNYQFYGNQKESKPLQIISWDVFGYYLYLPATFIYNDPGLKNEVWLKEVNAKYNCSPYLYQIAGGSKGKKRIIYQAGLSYFFAPGFFIAHLYAKVFGYPADGFSSPYQWSILITSLLVTFIGLFYLRKLLLQFFSDTVTALTIVILCFGTNWFLTVGYGHGMPHSFLFTLNILIVYCTKQWFDTHKRMYAILTAFALAWAYNCRPTELALILIPLLWHVESIADFKEKIKSSSVYKSNLIAFAITFVLVTLPQLAYMQYASNDILKVNLHTEKLSLFHPYTMQFLFSYKKGWLLYTPIMLFVIAGFVPLYLKSKSIFYALFLFFVINVWLTSSWENWWYAASYSQRPMVETYGILALPLGFLMQFILDKKRVVTILFFIAISLVFLLTVFQSRQFYVGIIHNERMSKAYYWKVFGRLQVDANDLKLLEPDRGDNNFSGDLNSFELVPVKNLDFKTNVSLRPFLKYIDGKTVVQLDSGNHIVQLFEIEKSSVTDKKYFWVRGSIKLLMPDTSKIEGVIFSIKTDAEKNRTIKQSIYRPDAVTSTPGVWQTIKFDYITPNFFHDNDKIKFVFEYYNNQTIFIDSLKIDFLIPKTDY